MPERPSIEPGWIFSITDRDVGRSTIWECLEVRDDEGIFLFRQKATVGSPNGTILRDGIKYNEFQRMLDNRHARRIHVPATGLGLKRASAIDVPPSNTGGSDKDRNEGSCKDEIQEDFRKAVCDTFDRDQDISRSKFCGRRYSKSDSKLRKLVLDVLLRHPEWRDVDLCKSPGAVRSWLRSRGVPG